MISKLEECIESVAARRSRVETIDVTDALETIVRCEGRHVQVARLRYSGPTKHSWLAMILSPHGRAPRASGMQRNLTEYRLCDVPSLVSGLAAIISQRSAGLAMDSLLSQGDLPRMFLVFEGCPAATTSSLRDLCTSLWSFLRRWSEWERVLNAILERDPFLKDLSVDVREFLLAETPASPLPYDDHALIIERLSIASKALLTSVLDQQQMNDPLVASLFRYLGDLQPNDMPMAAVNREVIDSVF